MSNHRIMMTLLIPSLLVLAACGGDSVEDKQEELGDLYDEATEILKGVTDEASAKAASSKLGDVAKKIQEVQEDLKAKLEGMSADEKLNSLKGQAGQHLDKLKAFTTEVARIMSSSYGSALADALSKIKK